MKHWIDYIRSTEYTTYQALKEQWDWFCKSDSYFALFENFDETLDKFKKTIQILHTTIQIIKEASKNKQTDVFNVYTAKNETWLF